jgi:uncharacterized protein YndB with AHSA1/START domain
MSNDLELSVTCLIDAPVDVVWRVFTEQTNEWYCPKPWRAEVDWDLRAGGRSSTVMYGPNGEENRMEGIILEAVPGKRVVFTDAFKGDWTPQGPFMVGFFEFEDEGGKTRYTGRARHWTEVAKQQHQAMGFADGWGKVAEQLAELAENAKAEA